ncbi:MAG: TonB-dependent receptor, partial [Gammaproteobacteria bacterium]|nr:TonB-dependent receptor [Gammaproteobacteria bacterium]
QVNGWYTGNFKSNAGDFNVTEGFVEAVLPLMNQGSLGTADFNAAVRLTDYSTSGTVTTWKAGVTWNPIDDVRVRGMLSRDIRAPNISELYIAGATQAVDVIDPQNGNGVFRITQVTDGNLNLSPERADTLGIGVVLQPEFLPGFQASVDYYDIDLNGAITSLSVNEIAARCAGGESELCSFITRNSSNIITEIRRVPINVANLRVRGIDFDLTYRLALDTLFDGAVGDLRLLFRANRALEYAFTNNGVTNDAVGENGGPQANPSIPKWQTYSQIAYDYSRFGLALTMRTVSAGEYDVTWESGVDIDNNTIKGATYFDLGGSYQLSGADDGGAELYFKIDNLLDKDPPVAALNFSSGIQTNTALYDVLGRTYRVGMRLRY